VADRGIPPEQIDTSKPHSARMYDYMLGGWDNYEVDREAVERLVAAVPEARAVARANRAFLQRVVRYLANLGIRQFIDIGAGIPVEPNVHEIAQAFSPDIRVAYVDNDPIVGSHANARLATVDTTGFVLADLRDPQTLLRHPKIRALIDFDQPVGLLLVSVLHFITDQEDPAGIVATLRDALPVGSYLAISHVTDDSRLTGDQRRDATAVYDTASSRVSPRPHARILEFFAGFDLVDPGLVQVPCWRPDVPEPTDEHLERIGFYAGLGCKIN
jgi:hypothetical protein